MSKMEEAIAVLRQLKMTNMAAKLEEMPARPGFALLAADEAMLELFAHEYNSRESRKATRMLAKAHLKYPDASLDKTLDDPGRRLDRAGIERLATCKWIEEKKNLVVTGKAGTGKTYFACALAGCAIQKGLQPLYIKASHMINELDGCHFTGAYTGALKKYTDVRLPIVDDFGLMSLDVARCLQLFEVLDAREGSGSVLVVSQLPVKSWYETFQNNVYADACMSRLIGNAARLGFDGKDMRKAGQPQRMATSTWCRTSLTRQPAYWMNTLAGQT